MKWPRLIFAVLCFNFTAGMNAILRAGTAPPSEPQRDVLAQCLAPEAILRYDYDFPMALEGDVGEYSMHEYRAFAPLPPVITDTFVMVGSLNYRVFDADFDTDVLRGVHDLHALRLPIEAGWLSSSTPWVGILYLEPGLATDFQVINSESLDLNAGIGVGYRFSDNFFLALGAGYSRNYGENEVFPGVVLLWRPDEDFTLTISPDGIVPEWRINDDWRLRMKLELIGGRWTMEDDDGNARIVRLRGGTASLYLERRVSDQCWLMLGTGFNALANLRIADDSGSALLERDLEEGLVLRSGLKWVF